MLVIFLYLETNAVSNNSQVSVSMTMNGAVLPVLAMYIVAAEVIMAILGMRSFRS